MSWVSEYRNSLKNIEVEEALDVYFFRPLAFIVVKILYRLPLTPNHYSLFSFLSGMISAFYFFNASFYLGTFFFFMFAVFDCCDGMQARLKKNGSEFGRFIDGLVDYVVNIFCYTALCFGVAKAFPYTGAIPTVYLVIAAGASKAIHSFMFDHFLMEYMSYESGEFGFTEKEIAILEEKISLAKKDPKTSWRRMFMLRAYYLFTTMQAGSAKESIAKFDPKEYIQKNILAMKLWGLIGPAWHIMALVLAFATNRPEWLFYYAVIFANAWLVMMLFYQNRIYRSMSLNKAIL